MRKVDGSSGPEDYDGVADKVAKRAGKQMGWSRAAWDEDWQKVDSQLRAGPRAMDMAVIRSELATMAFWKSRGSANTHASCVRFALWGSTCHMFATGLIGSWLRGSRC